MKKIISLFLVLSTLLSSLCIFSSCSDKELAAFEGELFGEVLSIKNDANAIITIVHDDGDMDTVEYLAKEFSAYNLTGTIAMVADRVVDEKGNEKSQADAWKTIVKENNFDIACHTQTHTWYGMTDDASSGIYQHRDKGPTAFDFPDGHITDETVGAAERLRNVFESSKQRILCYCYPGFPTTEKGYDGKTPEALEIIDSNFLAARAGSGKTTFRGLTLADMNDLRNLDFMNLLSHPVNTSEDGDTWIAYVDSAIENNAWGIFMFHAIVRQETDYAGSVARNKATKLFRYMGKKVKNGEIWCATFTEATLYCREFQTAEATVTHSGKGIEVSVTDGLDDSIYNEPLTVKVQVLDSWTTAKIKYKGKTEKVNVLTDENGMKYVCVNVIPDDGVAVVKKG